MIAPWYALMYVKLERVAWRHGYCLAVHGSMSRDFDLVAVPWTEDADSAEKLVKSFIRYIVSKANVKYSLPLPTLKPHGRKAYTLSIGYEGHYLDLSVMPLSGSSKSHRTRKGE